MIYKTSNGQEVTAQIVSEFCDLYRNCRGAHLAGRFWREVLDDEQRIALGGNFKDAYLNEHALAGMYQVLNPGVTLERAVLEVMRAVGWLAEAKYERLLKAIGEPRELPPSRGVCPAWDKSRATLFYGRQPVRSVRQPGKASRVVSLLDAFEERGWPFRLDRASLGNQSARKLRDTVSTLNCGLKMLKFKMDGEGQGVVWERI